MIDWFNNLIATVKSKVSGSSAAKHALYLYADQMLVDAQEQLKTRTDKQIDNWFAQKRAELKTKLGE